MMKAVGAGVVMAVLAMTGAAEARDNTAAILGGVAAGAVGGVVLGTVLSGAAQARPAPVYVQPAPPPPPVVVAAPPLVRPVVASPYDGQLFDLKMACDGGNRRACIRFGVFIGRHQERVADWRRAHPDFFAYED